VEGSVKMNSEETRPTTSGMSGVSTPSLITAMFAFLGILFGTLYAWEDCVHGELAPQVLSVLFTPAVWIAARQPFAHNRSNRIALALVVCCFGFGWFAVWANIRMGYTDWLIARGVHRNPNSRVLLVCYMAATTVISGLSAFIPFHLMLKTKPS